MSAAWSPEGHFTHDVLWRKGRGKWALYATVKTKAAGSRHATTLRKRGYQAKVVKSNSPYIGVRKNPDIPDRFPVWESEGKGHWSRRVGQYMGSVSKARAGYRSPYVWSAWWRGPKSNDIIASGDAKSLQHAKDWADNSIGRHATTRGPLRPNPGRRGRSGLIARWESRGGRQWVELFGNGDGTYSYRMDNGGGHLGRLLGDPVAEMERRMEFIAPSARRVTGRRSNPGGGTRACPCHCRGKIADHDERGWGPWSCPTCGEDSDRDLGEECSDCSRGVSDRERSFGPRKNPDWLRPGVLAKFRAAYLKRVGWHTSVPRDVKVVSLFDLGGKSAVRVRLSTTGNLMSVLAEDLLPLGKPDYSGM